MAESIDSILTGAGVDTDLVMQASKLFEGKPTSDLVICCMTLTAAAISFKPREEQMAATEHAVDLLRTLILLKAEGHGAP